MSSDNVSKITAGWDENVIDNLHLYDAKVNPLRGIDKDTEQVAAVDPGIPQPAGADPNVPSNDLDPNPAMPTTDEQRTGSEPPAPGG